MKIDALALALNRAKPNAWNIVGYAQWRTDCQYIANAYRALHPRFDKDEFLAACGVK